MATYEFYVESMNGNELTLSFVGGRPEVDAGISGQCKVVYKDDKLSFTGLDKGGKDAAFFNFWSRGANNRTFVTRTFLNDD